MKIILVRHGETSYNKELRYQGQTDVPLNDEGIKQAEKVRDRLKNEKISFIYSSDLKRAYKTAKIIVEPHKLKIRKLSSLREINYGIFEGKLLKDVRVKYKKLLENWWKYPMETKIPKGETVKEFNERVVSSFKKIIKNKKGNILIVSHGGPIRLIIAHCLNMPLINVRLIRQDNVCINVIERRENKFVLTLVNDICHLEEEKYEK